MPRRNDGLQRRLGCWLTAGSLTVLLSAAHAPAEDLLSDRGGWKKLAVPGRAETTFEFVDGIGLRMHSDSSVVFLYRDLPKLSGKTAILDWRWQLSGVVRSSDLSVVGADDRPAALHVWIDRAETSGSLFGPIAGLFGYPRVTHVLTYVWGGSRPAGTMMRNPYLDNGAIIILREPDAPSRTWLPERRDLAADLARAFGPDVGLADIRQIAVSSDTDDLGGRIMADFSGIHLQDVNR